MQRAGTTVDDEGNAIGALATVKEIQGTLGSPSARDVQIAGANGQVVNQVFATTDGEAQPGDVLVVRDHTWDVLSVEDVRLHNRLHLGRTSEQ